LRDAALDGVAGPLERVAIGLVRRRFARRYLDRYRELTGLREVEVQEWRLPILVARVAEGVPSEAQALRDAVTAELRRP
jgi:hypothetical protein